MRLVLSVLLLVFAPNLYPANGEARDLSAGERIYREGLLPSGAALRGILPGGTEVTGARAACAACHRRSGMGAGEGQTVAPPVTGAALYQPRDASVAQLAYLALRHARRPAYTDTSLAHALRNGTDAAGRPLAAPMPRYALSDAELGVLTRYLNALSPVVAPGVTGEEIHFATVVTDGVPPSQRKAMLEVLEAFVRDKNAGTRYETRRASRGPWTMTDYRAYRKWRLHVWELHGPPDEWAAQLEQHYGEQPVFAVLAGIAAGTWRPVHDFCNDRRIPCLFPTTDLPGDARTDSYALYFTEGMRLEAQVVAQSLKNASAAQVIQVYGRDAESVAAAAAFREAWQAPLSERQVDRDDPALWRELLQHRRDVHLVVWLGERDLAALTIWSDSLKQVMLSSTLVDRWPVVPAVLTGKVVAVHPFALPLHQARQLTRLRAWLRQKQLPADEPRIRANTYFAATMAADGLMQIANTFSRDYFIERIEDMTDDALTRSVYPRVSLGPGQRYASKGAYIVNLSGDSATQAASPWVIP